MDLLQVAKRTAAYHLVSWEQWSVLIDHTQVLPLVAPAAFAVPGQEMMGHELEYKYWVQRDSGSIEVDLLELEGGSRSRLT